MSKRKTPNGCFAFEAQAKELAQKAALAAREWQGAGLAEGARGPSGKEPKADSPGSLAGPSWADAWRWLTGPGNRWESNMRARAAALRQARRTLPEGAGGALAPPVGPEWAALGAPPIFGGHQMAREAQEWATAAPEKSMAVSRAFALALASEPEGAGLDAAIDGARAWAAQSPACATWLLAMMSRVKEEQMRSPLDFFELACPGGALESAWESARKSARDSGDGIQAGKADQADGRGFPPDQPLPLPLASTAQSPQSPWRHAGASALLETHWWGQAAVKAWGEPPARAALEGLAGRLEDLSARAARREESHGWIAPMTPWGDSVRAMDMERALGQAIRARANGESAPEKISFAAQFLAVEEVGPPDGASDGAGKWTEPPARGQPDPLALIRGAARRRWSQRLLDWAWPELTARGATPPSGLAARWLDGGSWAAASREKLLRAVGEGALGAETADPWAWHRIAGVSLAKGRHGEIAAIGQIIRERGRPALDAQIKNRKGSFGLFCARIKGHRVTPRVSTLPMAALAMGDAQALAALLGQGAKLPSERAFWREKKRIETAFARVSNVAAMNPSGLSPRQLLEPMTSLWQRQKLWGQVEQAEQAARAQSQSAGEGRGASEEASGAPAASAGRSPRRI